MHVAAYGTALIGGMTAALQEYTKNHNFYLLRSYRDNAIMSTSQMLLAVELDLLQKC